MTCLTFVFEATECNGWPRIRIGVDGDVLVDHDFVCAAESVNVDLDLEPGNHVLEIERWGKQTINVDFRDGKILQDQTVTLKDIYLQDVKLPYWFIISGRFCSDQGVLDQVTTWGPNGTYQLRFGFPLERWLLQEKVKRYHTVETVFGPTDSNHSHLRSVLDQFEQDLKRVQV